jgi:hypothetical protein
MQVGLARLNLPVSTWVASMVTYRIGSHEPARFPVSRSQGGLRPSVIREPHVHAARRGQLPLPQRRSRACRYWAASLASRCRRAQIMVTSTDASPLARGRG